MKEMKEQRNSAILLMSGIKALVVGLGVYFVLTAILVLVFWFAPVPEAFMTYAGALCLTGGCLAAGLKLGSCTGKKGILMGFLAAAVLALLLWGLTNLIAGGNLYENASPVKLVIGIAGGILGGMIGVNK